jgi:serine/threonine-protein kinase
VQPSDASDLRQDLERALRDSFDIERELGGGGMSRVFLARDRSLGRRVVVKVVPGELASTVSAERFKREISLAAALQHPHVVPLLQAGEVAGVPWYTMPFVEGESVRARIDREGALPIRDTVRILKDVARALAYAHERGIVHRDIKPDNVLLSSGAAAVTDFGVAKALGAARELPAAPSGTLTVIGTSLGTPTYMAPEQAAADPETDHRADIYAFGVMAYEMLAGQPPFHGMSPQKLLAAQLTATPAPLAEHRADVPPALAALVMRCLEKDPADRPQSASEIVDALEDPAVMSGSGAWAASRPSSGAHASASMPSGVHTGSYSTSGVVRKPRYRLWVGGAIAALALVAVAAALLLQREDAATRPAAAGAQPASAAPSIAVLPFTNVGGDTSDAYFAEGMADELTGALGKVPGLRVASRTGAAALAGKGLEPTEIGRRLGVGTLLEGTVRRAGDRLRISAQLTSATDGIVLWSESYQREKRDVFAVQDELSQAIVGALRERLGGAASSMGAVHMSESRGTDDVEAYDLYLRGRYYFKKRGPEDLKQALALFEQAAGRDPRFARAQAGIADIYTLLPLYGAMDAGAAMPKALAAANRAIALDSLLAEAYASRGTIHVREWRWAEGLRDYDRAVALDASYATAWQWRGEAQLLAGRVDDAVSSLAEATRRDPASPVMAGSYAMAIAATGRTQEAIEEGRKAIALDPTLGVTRFFLGSILIDAGRPAEAVREMEEAVRAAGPTSITFAGVYAHALGAAGMRDSARAVLARMEANGARQRAPSAMAHALLGLGDTTQALAALERAVREKDPFFQAHVLIGPGYDRLRAMPAFRRVLEAANLDPAAFTAPPARR